MKFFKLVLFLMLVLVGACATTANNSFSVGAGEDGWVGNPTLFVQNTGIDVIRIYEEGRRIATVYPGQGECILLRNAQSSFSRLSFGFLASRDRWYSAQETFSEGSGWVWNINSNLPNFSEVDIYPSERCDIGD